MVVKKISEAIGKIVAAKKLAKNRPIYPYSKVMCHKKSRLPGFSKIGIIA
jgi:hypothetical protein